MASYVSTWAEFVTAMQGLGTTNPINLTADIDCNSEIPLGVSSSVGGNQGKTINGNGHQIRNLRTHVSSPVPIFAGGGSTNVTWTFNDVDFVNLCLDAAFFNVNGNNYAHFNRCRFTGRRDYYFATLPDYSANRLTFTQCFFNFTHSKTVTLEGQGQIYPIHDRYSNGAGIVSISLCKMKLNSSASVPFFSSQFDACNISGCYFYGTVYAVRGQWQSLSNKGLRVGKFGPLTCVWNADVITASGTTAWGLQSYAASGRSMYYNSTKWPDFYSGSNVTSVACTDAEMKSAQALLDKGLDIVVPIE